MTSALWIGRFFDPTTGEPFPNNQIPQDRISPIGQFYTSFLPDPDPNGEALVAANGITNFDQFVGRFDHALTESQTLSYSLNIFDRAEDDPFAFGGADVPGFGSSNLRTSQVHTVRHTYTISPSLVNSYQFGYARNNQPGVAPQNATSPSSIGFEDDSFVANRTFEGPPYINLFDRNIQLGNSIQGPQARVSENFQMQDAVTWVAGNHSLKFGFDGTFYKKDQTFLFVNQGIFTFSGLFGGNTTGNDYADLLVGTSPIAAQFGANGLRDDRQWASAIFAQDSWRLSPKLTLSLGLRWEYNSPITDAFDRVAYYRPGSTSQRLVDGSLTTLAGQVITVPEGGRAPNGLVYPGDPDNVLGGTVPRGGIQKDWNNFAPRIGIAYSPQPSDGILRTLFGDQQTVIRAGFGIFYAAIIGDGQLQQLSAPGFNGTNSFFFPGSGTLARPFDPDPFPEYNGNQGQIPNPFAANQFFISAPLTQMSRPVDPNIRTPYTYHYNLTVERGFLNDYVFTASYVGNRSLKLYAIEQVNPSLGTFIPVPDGREIPTPTASNTNSRRLNSDFRLGLAQTVSAGNSWHNALQLQVQKRYSQGLSYQVGYTWAKTITDLATFGSGAGTVGGNHPRAVLDLLDRNAGRGVALEDVPHRFVASWIWDLPFASNLTGPAAYLLDGWSFGGIATFSSGRPFQVFNPSDTTGSGSAIVSFADRGSETFTQMDPRENDARAFNAGAFSSFGATADGFVLADDFRRGTLGPTQFRLHNGTNNFDLIVRKMTPLWAEDVNLELRAEFFNAFNHTQFTTADLNLISPTFGKFNAAAEARVIQLAARISF